MTAWFRKPTRWAEQRAIGHGVAVRQRFSAFDSGADFETAKHDHHWRRPERRAVRIVETIVEIIVGIGLVVMTVLRAQFLAATSGGSPASALLQAVALSAMSGGLVAVGYIILEHRKPKVVSTAERAGGQREAAATGAAATAKRLRASADDSLRSLDNYIVPHALTMDPPEGLDHHRFVAALRAVVRELVVGTPGS